MSDEERIRRILRSELQNLFAQPIAQPAPRPIDDGEHLEAVISHLNSCKDPYCNVNNRLDGIVQQNYKACPECSEIVKKDAKKCRHCGEEIEENNEDW